MFWDPTSFNIWHIYRTVRAHSNVYPCTVTRTRYLRRRTNNGAMDRPIFSFHPTDATIEFAHLMARKSSKIREDWAAEQLHAQGRIDAHWKAVLYKKESLVGLRETRETQAQALREAELALQWETRYTDVWQEYCSRWIQVQRPEWTRAEAHRASCQREVETTDRKIKAELEPPPPVIQPLPVSESEAMAVLYFLCATPLSLSFFLSFFLSVCIVPVVNMPRNHLT